MTSIKQNQGNAILPATEQSNSSSLALRSNNKIPDFRNFGVCLRILIIVNIVMLFAAILQSSTLAESAIRVTELSVNVQPILLLNLSILYLVYGQLNKLTQPWAMVSVIFLVLAITLPAAYFADYLLDFDYVSGAARISFARICIITLIVCFIVLYYFNLRYRALTPAIAEARLQALQARIRPHFLFNCINAVISVVRSNPKLAETALEDMADLFRVLMADNRDLVPLAKEIALSRQYLALEKLRLDERLQIVWQIENMPPDALMPPLVLQPLLENAVYHGIEPMPEGGEINISIFANRKQIHLKLTNPYPSQGSQHHGNKLALTNIRERLALHFDAEAQLINTIIHDKYEVHIVIPYHPYSTS